MEQAQPLSKGKSPVTILSGDAGGLAARILGPLVLEAKLSDDDRHGSATPINPLNSLEKAPRKKPLKRNFDNTLATEEYCCKYCEAKFGTLQSLGGHQNAHRRERAARKRARVMTRITKAFSQVNLKSNPNCSGVQANPVPGHPIAYGHRARPLPADVAGPAHGGTPKPITMTNPRASTSHRPAMVNQPNGIVYEPMSNVLANGSSFSTQGIENEGLDLTLRL